MSALHAAAVRQSAQPARRPAREPSRKSQPRLRIVRTPLPARSTASFLVLCMAILGVALLGVLLLNTSMARGSFEMSDLRQQVGRAAQDVQAKQSLVQAAEASLPQRARKLGMVESGTPTILRLSDGKVLGASVNP